MELLGKVETAFSLVLRGLLAETAYAELWISRGLEPEERIIPGVTFYCSSFSEEPDQTGNGFCDVTMIVRSGSDRHEDADDPRGDHDRLVAAVSVIHRTDLHSLLTAAVADLTVEREIESLPATTRPDKRCFVTEARWRLYAYNCRLTA